MKKKKIFIGVVVTLFLLVIVIAAALYHILTKSLPTTTGLLKVAGLASTVDVYRDDLGIPHIIAQNEYDLYFTAGFVTAQDRLWQMDLMRRYGEGRLSEIFGMRTLPIDKLMRTIGFSRIAAQLYSSVSQQTRNILDAYSKGVNACITEMKNKYPVEFDILQYTPSQWQPEECLLISRLMGWELAFSWWSDLMYSDLVQRLGPEKAREVFPFDDASKPTIISSSTNITGNETENFRKAILLARDFMNMRGSSVGSNGWIVTGNKSITGLPILANDPHLLLMQPARFYIMHLSAPGINVAGVSIPGTPGIIIGHNDRIAWGMTNLMADDVDFYAEHLSHNDSSYEYKGKIIPTTIRVDSIFVKDTLPIPYIVRSTHHGAIISEVYANHQFAHRQSRREALAMRWTGYEMTDEFLAVYKINHASSMDEFMSALQTFGVPGQNFIYADRSSNIAYQCAALIPIRSSDAASLPSAGYEGKGEWQGFVPFDKLPNETNPSENILATANNKPAGNIPYYISNLWEGDSRIRRIREMLHDQKVFAFNDFRLMQMDVQSPYAKDITSYFINALNADSTRSQEMMKMLNFFKQWDCRSYTSSTAATVYNVAFKHLIEETFKDEMGQDVFEQYVFLSNIPTRILPKLLADTTTTWFDNINTPQIETRDDILRRSVQLAYNDLKEKFGADINSWTWGKLHQVTFKHPLGEIKPLDKIFNVGPYEIGGDHTTVNNAEFSYDSPYAAVVGPAMRMIVNLASLDTCLIILPTGQSGQPLSKHYANQTIFWQNGVYHSLITNIETIKKTDWDKLTLHP